MNLVKIIIACLVAGNLFAQTYSEDIAPIIYKHCSNCHRPGEIGPFSLTNYQEVANWAFPIKFATRIKYMPPWKPDPNYQSFQHENYLSEQQIETISKWVDAGMPQGDPSKEPPFPNFPKGSQIGTPDLVLSFATSYTHKGNGKDEYRYFVLPTNLPEDKDLIALEMRPGNTKIVHHTLFWADVTGRARAEDAKTPEYGFTGSAAGVLGSDQLPGYVPGQKPNLFTNGMSQKVPKGSDLVLQMHYAPTSTDEKDSSSVNLFFSKTPSTRRVLNKILLPTDLVNGPFVIGPNQVKEFHAVYKVPAKVSLLGIWPHCHMLGKKWEVFVKMPDGSQVPLIKIPDWDFNWQGGYYFNKLIVVPQNAEIHAFCTYDNTSNNPVNPHTPPKTVTWGEGTADEMFYLPITYVSYKPGDENLVLNSEDPTFGIGDLAQIEEKIYPIYPNPVTGGMIHFGFVINRHKDLQIELLGIDGRKIATLLNKQHFFQGQHEIKKSLPNLNAGSYQIQIITEDSVLSAPFVYLK